MQQLIREVLTLQPKPPKSALLIHTLPTPLTHSHFVSLCLKFYHNLLNNFPIFNLHTHPHPQIQSFQGSQSNLFKMQI